MKHLWDISKLYVFVNGLSRKPWLSFSSSRDSPAESCRMNNGPWIMMGSRTMMDDVHGPWFMVFADHDVRGSCSSTMIVRGPWHVRLMKDVQKTRLAHESYLWSNFSGDLNFTSDFKLTYEIILGWLLEHRCWLRLFLIMYPLKLFREYSYLLL